MYQIVNFIVFYSLANIPTYLLTLAMRVKCYYHLLYCTKHANNIALLFFASHCERIK